MFTPLQIILICLAAALIQLEMNNSQQFIKCFGEKVMSGFIVGLIMGDYKTGLVVGGTMELMALGISGFGGASVPNYLVGTMVGTAFACATGGSIETALLVGIPTATLGTSIDVLAKMAGSFWLHRCQKLVSEGQYKKMYNTVIFANLFGGRIFLANVLPILLYLLLGSLFIDNIVAVIPSWFINGLKAAGNMLPALGMAILLKYLPLKGNGHYLVLGFVLYTYLDMPILAITLVGLFLAVSLFKNLQDKQTFSQNVSAEVGNGGIGDE